MRGILGVVLCAAATVAAAQTPERFRDCPDCPEMVVVPAGSFEMGTQPTEEGRDFDEGPVHRVAIPRFALGRSHVTRGEFAAFVTATGHQANGCVEFDARTRALQPSAQRNFRATGFAQTDEHPAVCVSWDDAQAYVRWLTQRTSRAYRLPSEAEWEYAARAGTRTARFWGDGPDEACRHANVTDLTTAEALGARRTPDAIFMCSDGHVYTAPAASFLPNRFGLHDMLGNAWQWTEDCYRLSYNGAPSDGSAWVGEPCERIVRGGTWLLQPRRVRSGYRHKDDSDRRSVVIGFRVATLRVP